MKKVNESRNFFSPAHFQRRRMPDQQGMKLFKKFANLFGHFQFSQKEMFCNQNHFTHAGICVYN